MRAPLDIIEALRAARRAAIGAACEIDVAKARGHRDAMALQARVTRAVAAAEAAANAAVCAANLLLVEARARLHVPTGYSIDYLVDGEIRLLSECADAAVPREGDV